MSKVTLDHLRKGGLPRGLPERVYELCLRRDLLGEVDALNDKMRTTKIAVARGSDENAPPPRYGEGSEPPELAAITERLAALYDQIEDATGELRLRAIRDGEWRRWVNDHPPREGDQRDDTVTYGLCNADDLANDLGKWVLSWEGDTLAADDWDTHIAPLVSGGDYKALTQMVLIMQEVIEDPKLLRLASLGARTSNAADSPPEPSADPSPSTSDESPPSDTNTSTSTET